LLLVVRDKDALKRLEPYQIGRVGRVYFYKHYHQGLWYGFEERCIEALAAFCDVIVGVCVFAWKLIRVPLALVPSVRILKD
jgi:hypothetical protein